MTDEQISEAAGAARQSTGTSSYLYGINYSVDKFKQELNAAIKHFKSRRKEPALAGR